ncbi:MAG: lipopolysaccharide biosynthesis protein [Planctomycetota bacterium]
MINKILGWFQRVAKSKLASKFARDAVLLQIAAIVNTGLNFVTSIVLFRGLGVDGYGEYAEALTLYTFIFFVGNVGFSQLAIARVAEAMGRGSEGDVTRWLGFFYKAYGILSFTLAVGGFIVLPAIGNYIFGDTKIGLLGAYLGMQGLISLPFYLVQCALTGTRRMRILAEMENLKELVRAYLIISLTLSIGDPRGAIAGEVAGAIFSIPLAILAYKKATAEPGMMLPGLREILKQSREINGKEIIEMAKKGALLSVNKNFQALMPTVFPRLVLGYFAGHREVGYLNLGQNLMKLPLQGLQGVSRAIMPALGQLRGAGQEDRLRSFLVKVMTLSGLSIMFATAVWGVLLYFAIPIFYGDSARPVLPLLWWLFIANTIAGFAVGSEAFFIVVDKIDVAVKISLIFVSFSIPIGYALISKWHTEGAAAFVALVHGSAATSVCYIIYYLSKRRAETPRLDA